MQLNSTLTNIASTVPHYQASALGSALTELDEEILVAIGVYQPIMTKHIASQLSINHKSTYTRRDINSRLFKTLSSYLVQDEYFRWSLRYEDLEYKDQKEDPEEGQYIDGDVVNLDSTVRIRFSNGKELKVRFTKVNSSRSNGPQADITYIYYKSPLAEALMRKEVGDVCRLLGSEYEVLEID